MTRKPTPKQQRFIQAYVENGGNATQAALVAYDTDYATARVIGHENLTKPNIRREIEKRMVKVDLTVEDALRTVKEALDATNEKGPEWPSRLKAADMTLKLADAYPSEAKAQQEMHLHQHLHIEQERRMQEAMAQEPVQVLHFIRVYGHWPTEEQRKILLEGTPEERLGLLQGDRE